MLIPVQKKLSDFGGVPWYLSNLYIALFSYLLLTTYSVFTYGEYTMK